MRRLFSWPNRPPPEKSFLRFKIKSIIEFVKNDERGKANAEMQVE
jgi:hypothetical protein